MGLLLHRQAGSRSAEQRLHLDDGVDVVKKAHVNVSALCKFHETLYGVTISTELPSFVKRLRVTSSTFPVGFSVNCM
jgi:hypothetical protein